METNTYATLSNYMDLLLDAICVVDKSGRFVFVSAGGERIFGYSPHEMIGLPMIDFVHPDDRAKTLQKAHKIMSGLQEPHFENRYIRKDGQIVHIMWSARWSETDQERVAVARDISKRKRAEAVQHAQYAIAQAAHNASDLNSLFEAIHRIVADLMHAPGFCIALYDQQSGELSYPYSVDPPPCSATLPNPDPSTFCAEVIGSGQALLLAPGTAADMPAALRELMGNHSRSWLGVPLKSGQGVMGALVVQNHADHGHYSEQDRELLQFVSTQIAAAIERKQLLEGLQRMALYDQLTGLPNRELFHDRIRLALARARREQGQLALLYLDLDRFKVVNDTYGHAAGDLLLEKVARRIEQSVRASDTVARFGGDEFVVLLENCGRAEDVGVIADKIRNALNQPFDLEGQSVTVVPSIGTAFYPRHGDDEKQLLRIADEAMYSAKKAGGNRVQLNGV
ncbi:MAG: diguanylate cyclase [Gammaproteobacteria bacterium BRH_c0]|nr:MAG: diguanylate cyclase [Gammaproteobacteria bacterium BRH_c0]